MLTSLHVVQQAIGYFLMLAIMTFNVWIFLSILIGTGLGHLLFGATDSDFNSQASNLSEVKEPKT